MVVIRENNIDVVGPFGEYTLKIPGMEDIIEKAIFFDLEHYIYKKPICIGVFGGCIYDSEKNQLLVTQYMIENKNDTIEILTLAKNYFIDMHKNRGKRYLVTFSGNNDFTVIKYLFKKYNINFVIEDYFTEIDMQKLFEKKSKLCVGLKALEKEFGIIRESELISGTNLAKTFSKVVKDNEYINRMPEGKKEKILLYNEQDVVSLYHLCYEWDRVTPKEGYRFQMFRDLRRKEKELSMEKVFEILKEGEYGTLATNDKKGFPYACPLNYVYYKGKIYFHSAIEGNKLDNIRKEPKVSFSVVGSSKVIPERFTSSYESVILFGIAEKCKGDEKLEAFNELILKYSPEYVDKAQDIIEKGLDNTEIIKINIEHLTGKANK